MLAWLVPFFAWLVPNLYLRLKLSLKYKEDAGVGQNLGEALSFEQAVELQEPEFPAVQSNLRATSPRHAAMYHADPEPSSWLYGSTGGPAGGKFGGPKPPTFGAGMPAERPPPGPLNLKMNIGDL